MAKRIYHTRRWKQLRRQVFERDNYRCTATGCGKIGRMECDHIKPMIDGGDVWAPSNLRTLCRGCHISITRQQHHARQAAQQPRTAAFRLLVQELERTTP